MDLATLKLVVDASGAVRTTDQFTKSLESNATQATKSGKALTSMGTAAKAAAGLAGVGSLALAMRKLVTESVEAQRVNAQLAAGLQSTHGASGQTIASLNAMAGALQKVSTFSDEAIGSGQALLLTFTKISGDVFPRATQAIVDMATRMGTDLTGAAIQVGKALNDPILGVTALGRAGVQFSEQQKAVIEGFVRTNQLVRAQGVILTEIETQFGGSAKAARDTLGGALTALSNAWGDLFEVSQDRSTGIIRAIDAVTASVERMPHAFSVVSRTLDIWASEALINFERVKRGLNLLDAGSASLIFGVTRGAIGGNAMAKNLAQAEANATEIAALNRVKEIHELALVALLKNNEAQRDGAGGAREHAAAIDAEAAAFERLARAAGMLPTGRGVTRVGVPKNAQGVEVPTLTPAALPGSDPASIYLAEVRRGLTDETAINGFRQNLSRAVGDAIAEGLMTGLRSPEAFIRSLRDVAATALGQAISDRVSGKISDALGGLGMAGLGAAAAGIGVFGAVADALFGASEKQREAAEAMQRAAEAVERGAQKQFGQDVAAWKASATATPEERALFGLQGTAANFAEEWFAKTLGSATGWRRDFLNSQRSMYGDIDFNEIAKILAGMQGESGLGAGSRVYTNAQMAEFQAIMEAYQANVQAITRAQDLSTANQVGAYRGTLSLSGFSPLSPMEQAKEARRQYDALVASALGGDRSAAEKLSGASNAFLQASRSVNASGGRYVADYNTVNQQLKMVEELFRGRATAEEQTATHTGTIVNNTQATNEILGDFATKLLARVDAQQEQLEEVVRVLKGITA